jgi:hypothetical protein
MSRIKRVNGASQQGDGSVRPDLRQFLQEVFDRLEDTLAMEEETDDGR